MNNLIDKIGEKVIPAANWFSTNHWISSIQKAYVEIMPLILVGSIITLYNSVIRYYIPSLPDLNIINTYSMGLTAVVLAVVLFLSGMTAGAFIAQPQESKSLTSSKLNMILKIMNELS